MTLTAEDLQAIRAVVREVVSHEPASDAPAPIQLTVDSLAVATGRHVQTIREHIRNNRRGLRRFTDGPPYSIRFEAVTKCYNLTREVALARLKASGRLQPHERSVV